MSGGAWAAILSAAWPAFRTASLTSFRCPSISMRLHLRIRHRWPEVHWMRANPLVCLEVEEITHRRELDDGAGVRLYQELTIHPNMPRHKAERTNPPLAIGGGAGNRQDAIERAACCGPVSHQRASPQGPAGVTDGIARVW